MIAQGYVIDTTCEDYWTSFADLKTVLVDSGAARGMSDTAIGKELGRLGLESHAVKHNGKPIKVRKYIKKVVEVEEDI